MNRAAGRAFEGRRTGVATSSIAAALLLLSASPDFTFRQSDGSKASLKKYAGNTVVLAFLHTECRHCQALCKVLDSIAKNYGPKGVRVLGIVFDDGASTRLRVFKDRYARLPRRPFR
ncbi:MAG: peroxiredoxin family protein [Bryobacteraceae bacterium]